MNKQLINNKVRTALPEFIPFLDDLDINEYTFFYFGKLGLFLSAAIKEKKEDIIDKAFCLVNELLDINDKELDTLINIGVLEILTDTAELQKVAIERLNAKGKDMFLALFDRFHKLF